MLTMSEEETLAAASLQGGGLPLMTSEEIKLKIMRRVYEERGEFERSRGRFV